MSIPTWLEARTMLQQGRSTPLSRFVYEEEPADIYHAREFRVRLEDVLKELEGRDHFPTFKLPEKQVVETTAVTDECETELVRSYDVREYGVVWQRDETWQIVHGERVLTGVREKDIGMSGAKGC